MDNEKVGIISEKPVYGRKSGQPVEVGKAMITMTEDSTEIVMVLTGENAQLLTEFLMSEMVQGISIGGVLDTNTASALNAKNN